MVGFVTTATFPGRGIIWNRTLLNAGTAPINIGWGAAIAPSVTTSANANVNLFAPQTEARTAGTASIVTTTWLGDTGKVVGTIICAGAGKTITEAGLFDTTTLSSTQTLSASLTASATTMTLGAQLLPSTGNFYAQVGNEVILVTGQVAVSNTIVRGALGSAAAIQVSGTSVTGGADGGAAGWTTLQTATMGASQGGSMFLHSDFAGVALNASDSISFTFTDTLTGLLILGLSSALSMAFGLSALFS